MSADSKSDETGKDGSKTTSFKIKMEKLEMELSSARNEIAEHVKVISTMAAENEELKTSLRTSYSHESSFKNQSLQTEKRILEVENRLKTAVEEKSIANRKIAKLYESIDQLQKLVQKLTAEKDAANLQIQTVVDQHEKTTTSLNKELEDSQKRQKMH